MRPLCLIVELERSARTDPFLLNLPLFLAHRSPLVESLFTRLPKNSTTAKHDPSLLALANNGWIWDADPLLDFASPGSRTYIRRDLIVWGDCVKLRYGAGRDDNPWLWDHMAHYVEQLAGMFDGFRLDNSHSTPIHVGEYLMDKAREVNPDLYVCAELFTGRQELDLLWVCRLGINSLIREAYSASSSSSLPLKLSMMHTLTSTPLQTPTARRRRAASSTASASASPSVRPSRSLPRSLFVASTRLTSLFSPQARWTPTA